MVVSVGEILVDLFGSQSEGIVSYGQRAGGAPFNVVCAAKRSGYKSGFVGRVGQDVFGKFLTDFAGNARLDYLDVAVDRSSNTTLAVVSIDETGERSFCFYRKNTADYKIDAEQIKNAVKHAKILHLGTLMLSEEQGVAAAETTIKLAKEEGKIISIDVNYRDDIFGDLDAVSIYKRFLSSADIIKLSEEELDLFAVGNSLEEKISCFPNATLTCVTLGGKGSAFYYKGECRYAGSIKVSPVDTTGAGDAFFGCLLGQLDELGIENVSVEQMVEVFKRANVCGALTTTGYGAIDPIPTAEEIERYL